LGRTEMSRRELGRVELLAWVRSGELQVVDAAALMRVSYRQAKRLWKRYGEEGATGLKHRSAGRTSNRTHPEKFREKCWGWWGRSTAWHQGLTGARPLTISLRPSSPIWIYCRHIRDFRPRSGQRGSTQFAKQIRRSLTLMDEFRPYVA
jgi:hypothetical protein